MLLGPACNRVPPASEVSGDQAALGSAAIGRTVVPSDARQSAPDPVDVDAERVLAVMPAAWRTMLAQAEEFNRRERVGWCTTCHVNTRDQLRGGAHDKNSISCVECHGASERHARDENNDIKPDQRFLRRDVDRVCGECHDCERPIATAEAAASAPVCTACHPAHKFPSLPAPLPK